MSHQSSHPTPHYLRFGPKFGVTVKNFARAATAARVTKRNAIERELWLGQFEVYSSFGYLGVFIGCRLSSRWSLIGCNGRVTDVVTGLFSVGLSGVGSVFDRNFSQRKTPRGTYPLYLSVSRIAPFLSQNPGTAHILKKIGASKDQVDLLHCALKTHLVHTLAFIVNLALASDEKSCRLRSNIRGDCPLPSTTRRGQAPCIASHQPTTAGSCSAPGEFATSRPLPDLSTL